MSLAVSDVTAQCNTLLTAANAAIATEQAKAPSDQRPAYISEQIGQVTALQAIKDFIAAG